MGKVHDTPQHRATRAHYRRIVDAGQGWCSEIICLEPTRYIQPGAPVDAAHDRTNGGYLGPAHPRCNRAEGGRVRHQKNPKRWIL